MNESYTNETKEVIPCDDITVYKWFREKTCCGLGDIKQYVKKLINVMKHRPTYRTDSIMELVYVEPLNDGMLRKRADDYAKSKDDSQNAYMRGYIDAYMNILGLNCPCEICPNNAEYMNGGECHCSKVER